MQWVWLALAFVGGAVFGTAYGHRARRTAYYVGSVVGYRHGLRDGWDDAKKLYDTEEEYVPHDVRYPPVAHDKIGEGYKAFLRSRYGSGYPVYPPIDLTGEDESGKGVDE